MTKEVILYYIKEKGIAEFATRGLGGKYKKQIPTWFLYLDQVEFGERLEKRILQEVDRFISGKKTIDKILAELFEEPKWVIEIEEGLIEKYPDLSVVNMF